MKVKLAKSNSMFFDPETGFRLMGDEVRDLDKMGYLTRQWVNGGGIVIVKDLVDEALKPEPTPMVEPEVVESTTDAEPEKNGGAATENPIPEPIKLIEPKIDDAVSEMLTKYTNAEIRAMAKERNFKFKMNLSVKKLAKMVIEFDRAKQK